MKTWKRTARVLSLTVVLAMLVALFAAFPVSAATEAAPSPKAQYNAYRVDGSAMTIDGKVTENEPWEKVEWTDTFGKLQSDDIDPDGAAADAAGKTKYLWSYEGAAGAATAANLYMLLTFEDPDGKYTAHTTSYMSDCFVVAIDETNAYNYSDKAIGKSNAADSYQHLSASMLTEASSEALAHKDSTWCTYFVSREGTKVTVEASIAFRGPAAYAKAENVIKFAVAIYRTVEKADGTLQYQKNAWGGLWPNTKNTAGIPAITLKEELASQLGAGENPGGQNPGGGEDPEQTVKADYYVNRVSDSSMVLDGAVSSREPWDRVAWTEPFKKQDGVTIDAVDSSANGNVVGKAKFLWSYEGAAGAAAAANLYMLLTFEDPDGVWTEHTTSYMSDCFVVSIDETNSCTGAMGKSNAADAFSRLSASMYTKSSTKIKSYQDSAWCSFVAIREGNTVTIEAKIQLKGIQEYAKAGSVMRVGVGVYRTITNADGSLSYQKNAWGGMWPNTKSPEKLSTIALLEEYPNGYSEIPKTGDMTQILPAVCLAVLSLVGLATCAFRKQQF